MSKAVGIDLGTTNSVICVLEGGQPHIVASSEGQRTTPSVVGFDREGHAMVGQVARRQLVTNPTRTFKSVKRQLGTDQSVPVGEDTYTPTQLSALILGKLKRDAEEYLGEPVSDAVITVPAYFTDAQRQATKDAGEIAGLNVVRIVNEPTAAALAYGLDNAAPEETVLVFDLGGGTFDVSVLQLEADSDGFSSIQVLATAGDNHLGGDDFDAAFANWIAEQFLQESGVDVRADAAAMTRLVEAAEAAKVLLSSAFETPVNLPYLAAGDDGPVHLDMTVSRADFQKSTADLIGRCREPFHAVLADAGVEVSDLSHVILVGGSTRMPAITDLIRELTGGTDPRKGVNADEVVAAGAALQAGVLTGEVSDVLLMDVTPLSLGLETRGGLMSTIIERNTAVPVRRTEVFTTGTDNQMSVKIGVYQGERPLVADNQLLGHFTLTGIPPASRGVPQIEVMFDIDANGIVHVSARDLATGRQQEMTVSGQQSLSAEQIEEMIGDAERHGRADEARRAAAQARVEAQMALESVSGFLTSAQEVPDEVREQVAQAAEELRQELAERRDDATALARATAKFSTTARKLGDALYGSERISDVSEDLFSDHVDADRDYNTSAGPDDSSDANPAVGTVEVPDGAEADDVDAAGVGDQPEWNLDGHSDGDVPTYVDEGRSSGLDEDGYEGGYTAVDEGQAYLAAAVAGDEFDADLDADAEPRP